MYSKRHKTRFRDVQDGCLVDFLILQLKETTWLILFNYVNMMCICLLVNKHVSYKLQLNV